MTNRSISSWGQIFDPMIAESMLDRLLQRSTVLECQIDGESHRMRAHQARAKKLRKVSQDADRGIMEGWRRSAAGGPCNSRAGMRDVLHRSRAAPYIVTYCAKCRGDLAIATATYDGHEEDAGGLVSMLWPPWLNKRES